MKLAALAVLLLAASPAVAQTPELVISDATGAEGDSGLTPFTFTLSLSAPASSTVRVKWFTERCTANPKEPCASDGDYVPADGVAVFPPGVVSQTVTVDVIGDTDREVRSSSRWACPTRRTRCWPRCRRVRGEGVILNDDGPLPAPARADFNGDGRTGHPVAEPDLPAAGGLADGRAQPRDRQLHHRRRVAGGRQLRRGRGGHGRLRPRRRCRPAFPVRCVRHPRVLVPGRPRARQRAHAARTGRSRLARRGDGRLRPRRADGPAVAP